MKGQGDTRFLEKHGRQWRVVVFVPKPLRPLIGKAALRHGLKTDSLQIAQSRRWKTVTEFQGLITAARSRLASSSSLNPSGPLVTEAIALACCRFCGRAVKLIRPSARTQSG